MLSVTGTLALASTGVLTFLAFRPSAIGYAYELTPVLVEE